MACAAVVVLLALLSFHASLRRAHLGTCAVALWLIGFRYAAEAARPAAQNQIVVGLLLFMFAIVPSEASRPPRSWRPQQV
jgi:hypothetical protein